MTDEDLFREFKRLPDKCVVVMEDIDACNILREESKEKHRVQEKLDKVQDNIEFF